MPIVIGNDPVTPVPSAAFGGMIDSIVKKIMGTIKFDYKKADPAELKLAVSSLGDGVNGMVLHAGQALKPAIDVLLNADDLAIDKAVEAEIAGNKFVVAAIHAEIDAIWPKKGTFNASAPMTGADVQNYLDLLSASEKSEGHSAPNFNAKSIELMKAHPEVVRLLMKTTRSRQLKAVTDDSFMQKVIDFLTRYGPIMAQVLSVLLMFI